MKILLEAEDVRWATTSMAIPGGSMMNIRWMVVVVGGKQFHVRREIDPMFMYMDQEEAKTEIDKLLFREMEIMLAKMFRESAASVPDGDMAIRKTATL
jgi:hypothetical protein